MVKIGLVVPVYKNFLGFAELMRTVDTDVQPFVIDNWTNNKGVSRGWNIGLADADDAGCDVAIVANDDILFHRGAVRKLVSAVWNRGFDLATATNTRDTPLVEKGDPIDKDPDFACFAVRPGEFLNRFGHFDENFSPAYFEDNDMHYRLKLQEAIVGRLRFAGMFHKGSVTQNWDGQQVVSGPMFEANRAYYAKKWGGVPGEERFATPYGRDNVEVSYW